MKIIKEQNMPLLHRKRITFLIDHVNQPTPKEVDVKKQIAEHEKVSEDLVAIRHIYTNFGQNSSKVIVGIYSSKEDYDKIEIIKKKPKKNGKKKGKEQAAK